MRTCAVDGCEKPTRGTRLCSMHWTRLKRHGNIDGLRPQGDPLDRLMRRVEKQEAGCWIFTGPTKNGYAVVGVGRDGWAYGHRLAYERIVGPIPEDRPRLHHTCETRRCVNPDHLVPTSAAEHAREHGHGLETCPTCGFNDWYYRKDNGARRCRECRRRYRRRTEGKRAA